MPLCCWRAAAALPACWPGPCSYRPVRQRDDASTAFGWVFVLRHLKLANVGVVYSVSMVLLLTALGAVVFRESLNAHEAAGLVLTVAALVLLTRFGS
jgi:hypothetical protein